MAITPINCHESDMLNAGESAFTDACVIDVVQILNTNQVSIKVYPLYEGRIDLIMEEDRVYNFIDFQVPFQITATTIFYSDTIRAAKFKICDLASPLEPTLKVVSVLPELYPNGDLPEYDRYGVKVRVSLKGTGSGHIKLSWGRDHDEVFENMGESDTVYEYNLPLGEHSICAVLFNVEA